MTSTSSARGGLVRQNTFTKDPSTPAVRPLSTEANQARLVTTASTGETVAINAFSQDRVSLVGGRIVRRRSAGGDFNNKMSLKTNQTLSGEKKDRNSKDTAAERPKLVRRRTWTKEDGEALLRANKMFRQVEDMK